MSGAGTAISAGGIGFNLATGNYVGAALGVASAVLGGGLFGGGKQSSVLQGFKVNGSASANGFAGKVTAFDQLGNNWDATGETSYINGLGGQLLQPGFGVTDTAGLLKSLGGKSVPINLTVGADNTQIPAAVASFLNAGIGSDTAITTPTTMPSPNDSNVVLAQQKSIADQVARRGRASTILTSDFGSGDTLGN